MRLKYDLFKYATSKGQEKNCYKRDKNRIQTSKKEFCLTLDKVQKKRMKNELKIDGSFQIKFTIRLY